MPSGVASPACSAIVQQFLRGRSASNPSTKAWTRCRTSTRPHRPATRSSSSSIRARQPAGPTLAPAVTAGCVAVHTPDDGHAVAAPPSPIKIKRSTAGVLADPSPAILVQAVGPDVVRLVGLDQRRVPGLQVVGLASGPIGTAEDAVAIE